MEYKRIGDVLVNAGVISTDQLKMALDIQKEKKERLGTLLVQEGFITEQQLIRALEIQLGVDFVDLSKEELPGDLSRLVNRDVARKHSVVPVKVLRDELYLAMSDPLNFIAIEEVKGTSRMRVIPMIATQTAIERAISRLYGNEGASRAISEMQQEYSSESRQAARPSGIRLEADESASAPTIRLINSIIERAVTERASDIHIEPREGGVFVRMRVDGQLRNMLQVPKELQSNVISRVKVVGGMDISERKRPQDGRSEVRVKDREIDLRISTLPTVFGEKIVIRLLDQSAQVMTPESIGLQDEQLQQYHDLLKNSNGVILISGPTGSGKSNTMATMIRELNREEVNVVTLEDPVEFQIDGVNQVQINEKTGMTFANGLRSILRQDPDVISIGEIRDGETASIALRAAVTGHVVLSTVHTNNAVATIPRLLDIGAEEYLIAAALRGVLAQRLVRRICPHCKEEYTPTDAEWTGLRMKGERGNHKFYRGRGCPQCAHTGYHGRIAVFEILMVDNALRQAILDHANEGELSKVAHASGFQNMRSQCQKLVLNGTTTVEEAQKTIYSMED